MTLEQVVLPDERIPAAEELLARAQALGPLLAANAQRTETERQVPEENLRAIEDAGLFRLSIPRRYGGYETPLPVWVAVHAELGRSCGATAWVTSLLTVTNWLVGRFGEQAQDEVFGGDTAPRTCGVFAPSGTSRRVDGGWLVSGRWGWASGSNNATWALLGFSFGADPADVGFGIFSMADLTVEDTWFAAGMAGTGSNTVIGDEVFVPDHRVLTAAELMGGPLESPPDQGALYRAPVMSLSSVAIAATQLGLARAALDYVIERAATRGVSYTSYETQSAAPTVQLAIGDSAATIAVAESAVLRCADQIMADLASGHEPGLVERSRTRAVVSYATRLAAEAIGTLLSAHGASSFATSSPLQRIWRDAEVIRRHAFYVYETGIEVYGKILLGRDDLPTALI
jgi:alkylation response protein AidB-like acyl-CoA dehydrogenase